MQRAFHRFNASGAIICTAQRFNGVVIRKLELLHTSDLVSAIEKYQTVHTGPKSQFGGVQSGLLSCSYQEPGSKVASTLAAKIVRAKKARNESMVQRSAIPAKSFILCDFQSMGLALPT